MDAELEQLLSLARVIGAAEAALDAAYAALQTSASALLASGSWSLSEVSEASGLNEGELLDMLTLDGNNNFLEQMLPEELPNQKGPGSSRGSP